MILIFKLILIRDGTRLAMKWKLALRNCLTAVACTWLIRTQLVLSAINWNASKPWILIVNPASRRLRTRLALLSTILVDLDFSSLSLMSFTLCVWWSLPVWLTLYVSFFKFIYLSIFLPFLPLLEFRAGKQSTKKKLKNKKL